MLKLQDYLRERTAKQKLILGGAFLATFLTIAGFAWFANQPNMALLYAGLEPGQAGTVVAAIEKSGTPYEVRGDSIFVPTDQRDALRMALASEGLPAAGGSGYEILDGMSGFGTTSQMFDAAYWRAKEGELGRTILALPNVKSARVHLAVPAGRGYKREAQASASVTLTTNGTPISQVQGRALRYLVSSGVPGMSADAVTVIDSQRGVVPSGDEMASESRAVEMKRNVERILEPHVGLGNVIVELNLDLVTEAELLTEQRFDPQQRALISQESQESSDQSSNAQNGAVSAASNLPEGQGDQGDQSKSARSETRQRSNFEVSRVTREVRKQPGDIRRLTVAVLVNGTAQKNEAGELVATPRPEAELETIRELVSSAVGFDEARGDQLTVKSLPFAGIDGEGVLATHGGLFDRLELNSLARIALIGLFALILAALILRPMLKGRAGGKAALDLSGRGTDPTLLPPVAQAIAVEVEPVTPAVAPEIDFVPLNGPDADPVARLRELMKEKREESVRILSGWIERREDAI